LLDPKAGKYNTRVPKIQGYQSSYGANGTRVTHHLVVPRHRAKFKEIFESAERERTHARHTHAHTQYIHAHTHIHTHTWTAHEHPCDDEHHRDDGKLALQQDDGKLALQQDDGKLALQQRDEHHPDADLCVASSSLSLSLSLSLPPSLSLSLPSLVVEGCTVCVPSVFRMCS